MEYFEDSNEIEEEDREFEKCVRETPSEVKHASFTIIPNYIHRNVSWEKWRGTPRASTVWLLAGHIIRAEMRNKMATAIYKKYYLKRNLLVARYTQAGLARLLGYASRKAVNNQLKQCEKEGIFKIEEMLWGNRKIKIYIFGSWEDKTGTHYMETFNMFTKFKKEEAKKELKKKFLK